MNDNRLLDYLDHIIEAAQQACDEEALLDRRRLDFLLFWEFERGGELPDASTLCRFRKRLVSAPLP